VAAIPALLIYRYLRRRDFTQVCMSCAAHKIRVWSLLIAYLALTLLNPSITVHHVPFETEGIPLDEAMEHSPTATLELRLCHPENDRLERELKANGRLTDEVLAAAPQIEGYRLMRVRGKDDSICYVCDDVELSMEDIVSARASKSLFNEDIYEVSAKLTPEGRGRLARLTRDYKPHGAKNSSNQGRALAIVVNGELAAAPIIQTEIDMGEFIITGKFTKEEAVNLAAALNSKGGE
jgi:preprotein translocase subunit SecD